jgi:hypothetical protein
MLSLFCLYNHEGLRLDKWTTLDNRVGEAWLCTMVVDLEPPTPNWKPFSPHVWCGEKSGTLLIIGAFHSVHRINIQTGTMDDVTNQFGRLDDMAVPMEVDWPVAATAWRLGEHNVLQELYPSSSD